ncbi:MAG: hypothetical protein HY722_04730 [Planctomycetes bacterium]|nr:hypothetical protein [Planctomycetota bacterium]
MGAQKTFQGGMDHGDALGQVEALLSEVEQNMEDLARLFRAEFPARRVGDLILRVEPVQRFVSGTFREVPAGLEWRCLARIRCDGGTPWTRRAGLRLSRGFIERADRRGQGDRLVWFDVECGRLRKVRKQIVGALDRIRKQLLAILAKDPHSIDDLSPVTSALGQG